MNATPPICPQFNVPSTIIIGGGASGQIAAQAARFGARRALLVTDATMVATGLAKQMRRPAGGLKY